jgi:hypothetical protein
MSGLPDVQVPRRLLQGNLLHGCLHGCAALLALALSAFGGSRLGYERGDAGRSADERAIVRVAEVALVGLLAGAAIGVTQAASYRRAPRRLLGGPAALLVGARAGFALIAGARGPRAP